MDGCIWCRTWCNPASFSYVEFSLGKVRWHKDTLSVCGRVGISSWDGYKKYPHNFFSKWHTNVDMREAYVKTTTTTSSATTNNKPVCDDDKHSALVPLADGLGTESAVYVCQPPSQLLSPWPEKRFSFFWSKIYFWGWWGAAQSWSEKRFWPILFFWE